MLIPLSLTGATYRNRSKALSNQVTRNLYPEIQQNESGKTVYALMPFPGYTLLGTASGTNRGCVNHLGTLYKVTGQTLYSVNASGTHTSLGSIPGSGKCVFAPIGTNIVIASGGRVFQYNTATNAVAEILDADLESPDSVTHLNNQIIFDGLRGRFASSAVGDATDINALDYATAESDADNLERVYAFDQVLYLFGTQTIERWFNSSIGRPPFDRIQGGIIQVGLLAFHSVSNNANYLYFLGSDFHVYRIVGGSHAPITTFTHARKISEYTASEQAAISGFCLETVGQHFYLLNLPDETLCFHEESGQWFTLGEEGYRYAADGYVKAFGKGYVWGYADGNLYELDPETYTNNSATITRLRDTGPLHSGLLKMPGKEIEVNRFELIMETGVGTVSGQGVEPQVMLSVSPDGGKTWSTEMTAELGRMGDFLYKVEWGPLGTFDSCMFRVRVSDPVFVSIHGAAADVDVCI